MSAPNTTASLSAEMVSLEAQSIRLLDLYEAAIDNGNLSVASGVLKQLSDLHNLSKSNQAPDHLDALSDGQLDERIRDLIQKTGLAADAAATDPQK